MSDLSVLIPYKGDGGWRDFLFSWVLARYGALLPDAEIVIGTSEPFNRAAARNDAFRRSNGKIVVVADADTIFHTRQIREAIEVISAFKRTWVVPYGRRGYYNLSEAATEAILCRQPDEDIPEPVDSNDWEFRVESWAGLLVMPRAAYELVGGQDEQFCGWGLEDNAFRSALDTMWGHHTRLSQAYVLHLWHEVSHETTWGQPQFDENNRRYKRYLGAEGSPEKMRALIHGRQLP